jgi:thiamine-monophosphate kinase
MLRSGARPGDAIFLTGTAGAAQLGLTLLLRRQSVRRVPAALLRRHLRPEPRIALGCWLARRKLATAAIDTSDGFSTDLHRLCAASGVGARLEWSLIPAVRIPPGRAYARLDREQIVLHGGEDYELLFTVPGRLAQRLPQVWRGICITPIGRITRSREIRILGSDGSSRLLPARGWDPFADRKLRL